jgi:transposase
MTLTEEQQCELQDMRDHHEIAYLRERAAAMLKIAGGHSGLQTARNLLNRPHWQDTIYEWYKRYQAEGITGLKIRAGRGRKPSFSP